MNLMPARHGGSQPYRAGTGKKPHRKAEINRSFIVYNYKIELGTCLHQTLLIDNKSTCHYLGTCSPQLLWNNGLFILSLVLFLIKS